MPPRTVEVPLVEQRDPHRGLRRQLRVHIAASLGHVEQSLSKFARCNDLAAHKDVGELAPQCLGEQLRPRCGAAGVCRTAEKLAAAAFDILSVVCTTVASARESSASS